MRVSVLKDDPAYEPDANYLVLLDGRSINHVFIADEDTGEVLCCARDGNGNHVVKGGQIATELRRGRVEIRPASADHDGESTRRFA